MKKRLLTLAILLVSFSAFATVAPIVDSGRVCVGSFTTVSDPTAGGTWSTSSSGITIAGAGTTATVTGVSAGIATITYTVSGSSVTSPITVNALPTSYTVTGGGGYCPGSTGVHINLSGSGTGISYQLMLSGAAVGSSLIGTGAPLDFGLFSTAGIYTIVATNTVTHCQVTMTGSATIFTNPLPTVYTVYIAGSGSVCAGTPGSDIHLSGSQTGVSYQLFLGSSAWGAPVAGYGSSIDFGPVTYSGIYSAIGIDATTGCANNMGSTTVTVLPATVPITGTTGVCIGSTNILHNTTTGGGTWSSSTPAVATIGSSGTYTGVSVGSSVITFTAASTGCPVTTTVSVTNSILPITTTTTNICSGLSTTFTDTTAGGIWASSNPSVATAGSISGIIYGAAAGTATITYTIGGSCGLVTKTVTVLASPAAITGITSVCTGIPTTLHCATAGGVWTSSTPTVATIGSTSGYVTSITNGLTPISYTVAGCSSGTMITVDPPPVISGFSAICAYDTIQLGSSIYGTWSSSNPSVASVSSSLYSFNSIITGNSTGTAIITCTAYSTGCTTMRTVTVNSVCTGTPATDTAHLGAPSVCSDNINTLYLTGATHVCGTGYQWQSSPNTITWSNIYGGSFDSININPQATLYYRCMATCYSSGLFSYSNIISGSVYNTITAQYTIDTPSHFCNGLGFVINTCGSAPNSNILTYYSDGTSDSTHIQPPYIGVPYTIDTIFHAYNFSGTYTVKQVLRDGITRQDSATFTVNYNYCRTLPITYYFDTNNDSTLDGGDAMLTMPVSTEVDSNGIVIDTITTMNGFFYKAYGDSGTIYSFRPIGLDTNLSITSPAGGIIYDTISSYANTYTQKNFGTYCASTAAFDLGITADMYCGRHVAWGCINVRNTYCTPESTVVVMNFSPKYIFTGSYPSPYSVVGTTVTWHLPPVSIYAPYYEWPTIWYNLGITGPFLVTGDTVNSSFAVYPYTGDVDTTNNFVARVDTIISSYDPNFIAVTPQGNILPCTPLQYTINFENTGNDTAMNIFVMDTLSDNVDAHTIKIVSSTAVMNMYVTNESGHNIIKFDFPNIRLLDSAHHGQCNGQVVFTVKAKNSLPDGATIYNHAGIFFDDNPVVMTNTIENIIGINPISGPASVCNTAHVLLTEASTPGTWTCSSSTATVAAGLVTGVAAGTDIITYTVSNSCATKYATKAITIEPSVLPAITLAASPAWTDTVCSGSLTAFTTTATNGGSAPAYQWTVNGATVDTGSSYHYIPANGDVVTARLTSNALCALPDTASKTLHMVVLPEVTPTVSITATATTFVSVGQTDTLIASVINGGAHPAYQWEINTTPFPGATSSSFISDGFYNGDVITCDVTADGLCGTSSLSNTVTITLFNVSVPALNTKEGISIAPNPNRGTFLVQGALNLGADEEVSIEITDVLGNSVYKNKTTTTNGNLSATISFNNMPANGMYQVSLHSAHVDKELRFVVEQ